MVRVKTIFQGGVFGNLGLWITENAFCSFAFFWLPVVSPADFHKAAPYVVTGSVDQTVKVWECRWFGSSANWTSTPNYAGAPPNPTSLPAMPSPLSIPPAALTPPKLQLTYTLSSPFSCTYHRGYLTVALSAPITIVLLCKLFLDVDWAIKCYRRKKKTSILAW